MSADLDETPPYGSIRLLHWRRRTDVPLLILAIGSLQAAAVIPALAGFGALRVLRGGRALRDLVALIRLVAVGGAAAQQGRSVLRRHAAGFALGLARFTWLMSAVAFTLAEDVGAGEHRLHSFFDGLWWSTTTVTTVGYGDVFPGSHHHGRRDLHLRGRDGEGRGVPGAFRS